MGSKTEAFGFDFSRANSFFFLTHGVQSGSTALTASYLRVPGALSAGGGVSGRVTDEICLVSRLRISAHVIPLRIYFVERGKLERNSVERVIFKPEN